MMAYYDNSEVRGPNFIELKLYTENSSLREKLKAQAQEVNKSFHSSYYTDAGLDLYTPEEVTIKPGETALVDMEVKCAMFLHSNENRMTPLSYYMYPRSSTGTKTKLRLANSVGIIDSGYRGNLKAAFDNTGSEDETVSQHTRLVQVCSPTLEPFMVSVVDSLTDLGFTERNEGGFGSTGR